MAYLTKEDLILKLTPYGVKSAASINRLVREQGLPAKYLTPRKVFFEETEVDTWLSRRSLSVAQSNTTHTKIIRYQRKRRKGENPAQDGENSPISASASQSTEITPFKKQEA
ncbi:MAG: hypothetical protein LBP27_00470 [Treponema sp.]|jgi:hypothetical protein|nr:hypothetical protein [Treponema sp.]